MAGGLALATFAFEAAFSHTDWMLRLEFSSGSRITPVLWILSGWMAATSDLRGRRLTWDVLALGPATSLSDDELGALTGRVRKLPPRNVAIALLIALPAGVLVVADEGTSVPALFSDEPLTHDLLRGIGVNLVLFGVMGVGAARTFEGLRVLARLEQSLRPVTLLDLSPLYPFAQWGLWSALVWLGGSAIAGVVFVDQEFALGTAIVLLGTGGLGTAAFLLPLRGAHQSIRAAKREELARVRGAIELARDAALAPPSAAEPAAVATSARLPGLLAYEARIEEVREWPLDLPTVSRFGVLMFVALGSWLGGAVVERLLGVLLD